MAFDQAMKMMGSKKSGVGKSFKGEEKPTPAGKIGGEHEGGEEEPIHAHLKSMHEMTGNAHSHVEHHFDGSHTSHHISEHGEVSGPHDHENMDALKSHLDQVVGEGEPSAGNAEEEGASLGGYGG